MSRFSDINAILGHYDTESGVGNMYKFNDEWSKAIRAILFGWENTLDHSGAIHYGYDYNGKNTKEALNKAPLEAFENLGIQKGKVLDCGCGIGGTSYLLGPIYSKVFFVGISLSKGQIDIAKKRADKAGIDNVEYEVGDYLNMGYKSEMFDGVIAIETFCHVEDNLKPKLFDELYRILKTGGRIATFDAYLADRKEKDMHMTRRHTKIFRGWTLPDRISTANFFTKEAKRRGFKVSKNVNMTERILSWSKETRKRVIFAKPLIPLVKVSTWLRKFGIKLPVLSGLGFDDPYVLDFVYTAENQYEMFKSGDVEYREIVLEK